MIPNDSSSPRTADRDRRIAEIVAGCADRVNAGRIVDLDRIVAESPDLAPDLEIALETLLSLGSTPEIPKALVGKRLGDFHIVRGIGRGGMGVVYEARQESLDRAVALKVLPSSLLGRDSAVRRFVREARVAARLQHPNVVTTFGMGIESDTPYFAMELVDGETLGEILERRGRPAAPAEKSPSPTAFDAEELQLESFLEIARLFAGVAQGLQHAHARGVIHRDIKPSNLILDRTGALRILDFGLARLEGDERLTLSNDLVGTPLYMSPEQAARKKIEVGAPTDIYSLGATLYEALTLLAPFRGSDFNDTLQQILTRDPVPPRKIQPRIPASLETIVLKCMSKEPRDRYLTSEALAQDLLRAARGDAIEARPQSLLERTLRRTQRHRTKLLLGTVICALMISLVLVLISHQNQTELRRLAEYGPLVETAARQMQFRHQTNALHDVGDIAFEMQAFFGGISSLTEFIGTDQRTLALRAIVDLTKACELLPQRPEGFYHRAKAYMILQRFPEAEKDLDRAEANDPDFVPALMLRATLREIEGRNDAATALHREASNRATSAWSKCWVQAQLSMGNRAFLEAVESFGRLLSIESEGNPPFLGFSVDARLGRGVARLNLHDYEGAIDDFAYARAHWQDAAGPGLLLGRAHLSAGEAQRAHRIFTRVYDGAPFQDEVANWIAITYYDHADFDTALGWMDRIDEDFLRATGRAFVLISKESYDEAIEASDRCIALQPKSSIGWMLKGLAYFQRDRLQHPERLQLAYEMEKKAFEVDPQNPTAQCGFGVALVESGQVDRGISMLTQSLEIVEKNLVAHYYLGKAHELKGDLESAAGSYLSAIALAPGDPDSSARLAGIRIRQGRIPEARSLIDQVLEREPTNLLARISFASILVHDEKHEAAAELYRQLEEEAPYDFSLGERRAEALTAAGEFEQAIRLYRSLVRIARARADLQAALGEAYLANGNRDHAISAYRKAAEVDPNHPLYPRRLGEIFLELERPTDATEAFERSLQLDSSQEDLRKRLAELSPR